MTNEQIAELSRKTSRDYRRRQTSQKRAAALVLNGYAHLLADEDDAATAEESK